MRLNQVNKKVIQDEILKLRLAIDNNFTPNFINDKYGIWYYQVKCKTCGKLYNKHQISYLFKHYFKHKYGV